MRYAATVAKQNAPSPEAMVNFVQITKRVHFSRLPFSLRCLPAC
jgi:hypothetical protein